MALVVGGIKIDPQGQSLVVNITIPSTGQSVVAYTATTGPVPWPRTSSGAAASFPVTISTPTTFYVTAATDYLVSAKLNGNEVAAGFGQTATVHVDGQVVTLDPEITNFPDEARSGGGGGGVQTLAAADSTITVGGTAQARTVGVTPGTYGVATTLVVDPTNSQAYATITAALAAVPAGGAAVFVRRTYTGVGETFPLQPPSFTEIFGEGDASIIQLPNATNQNVVSVGAAVTDVVIRDLRIDGNRVNQSGSANGVAVFGQRVRVQRCHVLNANGYNIVAFAGALDVEFADNVSEGCRDEALECQGASRCIIRGNLVRNAGKNGIYVWANTAQAGVCHDVTVSGNEVWNASALSSAHAGIKIDDGATDVTVTGNAVMGGGATNAGIAAASDTATAISGITVTGNTVEAATNHAIWVYNATGVSVTGNSIRANTVGDGIRVESTASGVRLGDNVIQSPAARGIRIEGAAKVGVSDNVVSLAAQEGILFNTNSSKFTCVGNLVLASVATGIRTTTCTNGVINGNTLDGCGTGGSDGILVVGSTAVAVTGNQVDGGGSGGNGAGITAWTSADVSITGNVVSQVRAEGIHVLDSTNVTVTGNNCRANGVGGNGSHSNGITVEYSAGPCSGILITANRCADDVGVTQKYGLSTIGAVAYLTAIGNDLRGNGTSATNLSGTATNQTLRGNIGYNPVGTVSPAVPATTVATTAQVYDQMFYITNGSAQSTLAISNGPTVTVPASALATLKVPAGQTLTPTYTVAPTWVVEAE